MRTIESRRFVAGKAELRLFLVEEEGRLPFRVRVKTKNWAGSGAVGNGVLGGFVTEPEAVQALENHTVDALASGWRQIPGQVRLVLGVPAPPGAAPPTPPVPECAHESIQAYLARHPGRTLVCPECGVNVKA
jgi:hypothetical protein